MEDLMETEEELADFTLAEVVEMATLFNQNKEKPITLEFCEELATKFSSSPYRAGKSIIKWEQVQTWFSDMKNPKAAKATADKDEKSIIPRPRLSKKEKSKKLSSALVLHRNYSFSGYTRLPDCAYDMPQKPRVPAAQMAAELSGLAFEALSAKDLAWYDVASFLNFRVLRTGELEVRVRFAGFGHEEDEWVNVKRGVRERSIPLEPSECDTVNVGDHVTCFRADEYLAIYGDAHVVDIQKTLHDNARCTCTFLVRYDFDHFEEKVTLDKLCSRPTRSNNEVSVNVASQCLPES